MKFLISGVLGLLLAAGVSTTTIQLAGDSEPSSASLHNYGTR
ncbi:hypothetical protein [Actinocorallia sp. API 0066]|nr:hypothetical protein [Actinocorallia sp. API 0066]